MTIKEQCARQAGLQERSVSTLTFGIGVQAASVTGGNSELGRLGYGGSSRSQRPAELLRPRARQERGHSDDYPVTE